MLVRVEGKLSEDKSKVEAKRITILPNPEKGKRKPRMGAYRRVATGILVKEGDQLSLKVGDKTVAITGEPQVAKTVLGSLDDVKKGAFVTVLGAATPEGNRAFVIHLRPAPPKDRKGKKKE